MKDKGKMLWLYVKNWGSVIAVSYIPWLLLIAAGGCKYLFKMLSYAIYVLIADLFGIGIVMQQTRDKRKEIENIIRGSEIVEIMDEIYAMDIAQIILLREKTYKFVNRTRMSQIMKGLTAIVAAAVIGVLAGEVDWKELQFFKAENMLVLLFSLLFPIVLFILGVMGNLENICYSLETDYSDYNIRYIYELCDEIIKNEQMRNLNTWKKKQKKNKGCNRTDCELLR